MKEILVDDRYRIERKVGEGGFGLVYSGTDTQTGDEVAMKLSLVRNGPHMLRGEATTYQALAGEVGIPRVLWFGQECDFYVLVHDMLDPTLEDLFNYCGRHFTLKTILLIADQAISRIERIHAKGFLHRDIKPDNFLLGLGRQGNTLYTIDFGLATQYADVEAFHDRGIRPFGGTARYASINNHNGREQSWGDDLESLGYIFVYFARGSLPWQGLKAATEDERKTLIKEKKVNLSGEALCEGFLPAEFATYINYTRSLDFLTKPDYKYLRRLFRRLFASNGFSYDNVFDWTVKRFHEIHGHDAEHQPGSQQPSPQPRRRSLRKAKDHVKASRP